MGRIVVENVLLWLWVMKGADMCIPSGYSGIRHVTFIIAIRSAVAQRVSAFQPIASLTRLIKPSRVRY
jgi:hypothetical protein